MAFNRRVCRLEDAAVRAVPCAFEGAWLPCVGVAFTGHPRPLPKTKVTKHLPRYCSVRCNPFGNPEPAKASSWVVDKKDARIIISNEIDGDEETILNGAFIKTANRQAAAGAAAARGRRRGKLKRRRLEELFITYHVFQGLKYRSNCLHLRGSISRSLIPSCLQSLNAYHFC